MPKTMLFAFGFGNLAMLGWLAAIAAPLLIHLWSRHRYREAPWAAMQFLLAAMRKNARRLQLQQWLLLAVRMLIIALVVLAVAEPYGERLLADLGGGPTHKILIIDGSYSMDYRHDGESRFAQAKKNAVQLIQGSRSADTFTVILMAAPAQTILSYEVVDHAAVVAQVEALTLPQAGADLPSALALADEAIESADAKPGATARHQVYFITDLQRITWRQDSNAPTKSPSTAADRLSALAKFAELNVIDVGSDNAPNTAVTNVVISEPFITVGREVTFAATLRIFGPSSRAQCRVELLVDGVPVSEQTVDLQAGADAALRFSHRFQSAGEHAVEVRAAADQLKIDDSRWFVVPVREQIQVLCVAGRPNAAKYVADALNPSADGDSPIQPVIAAEGDLADIDLAGFDCVFLCNVAQFTPAEAQRLAQYAASGGGLVFFLGDRVERTNYNSNAAGANSLLPVMLGEVVDQQQFGIDPLGYRHPIVAPFRGRERAGLLTTPIARYHRLELPKDSADVQVAAARPNGDPLIVAAPLGLGRTVLVATDGSLSSVDATSGEPWTNWPTWPSFLPVVRELLAYAMSGKQQEWQQLVGVPIASRGALAPANTPPVSARPSTPIIERPDGRTAAVSIESSPTGSEWSYTNTDLSGLYTLRGLADGSSRSFAVNVDTRESDLSRVDAQQLPAELRSLDNTDNATPSTNVTALSRAGWNIPLLWTALALIFVESFLAWHFGRGSL